MVFSSCYTWGVRVMHNDEQILENMLKAIDLEIKAIKVSGRGSSGTINNGKYSGQVGDGHLYSFFVGDELYLQDDALIKVKVNNTEVSGSIVSFKEGILLISLDRHLGDFIPNATIVSDDTYLLEELKTKLDDAGKGGGKVTLDQAYRMFGRRNIKAHPIKQGSSLDLELKDLNDEQRSAVSASLKFPLTYLWGPPGTGKTTTLARIVDAYYKLGLSVLIVSNTNVAVDTALEKVCDGLSEKGDEDFQAGSIVRLGPIIKEELKLKYEDKVNLDGIVDRLAAVLIAERQDVTAKKEGVENELGPIEEAISDYESFQLADKRLKESTNKKVSQEQRMVELKGKIEDYGERGRALELKLQEAKNAGFLKKFFQGLDPARINEQIKDLHIKVRSSEDALRDVEEKHKLSIKERHQLNDVFEQIKTKIKGIESHESLIKKKKEFTQAIEGFNKRLAELNSEIEGVRAKVINNSRVLATTVYRTFVKKQVDRKFDVVIIDEASMIALPMCFYAAALAEQRVVVGGDFRQLPAIAMSREKDVEDWYKRDVFFVSGVVDMIKKGEVQEYVIPLHQQYRMNDDICKLINENFYPDNLLSTAVRLPAPENPITDCSFTLVDTSDLKPWTSMRFGTFSRYNILHAYVVRNLIQHLCEKGYYQPEDKNDDRIGCVSPYGAQVSLINSFLDELVIKTRRKIASTVHRFQGNEKDTIVFDITDSIGAFPSKFIKSCAVEQDGARLLNVALSRARSHIILVANMEYLRKELDPNTYLAKIITLFDSRAKKLDANWLLSIGKDNWWDSRSVHKAQMIEFDHEQSGFFSESLFYEAFTRDLNSVNREVVIFSPFMTKRGTSRWLDMFRSILARGGKIRIVTRPAGGHGGIMDESIDEIVEHLSGVGVVVDFRDSMHEKIAAIDEEVLWHGSLNILSHRDTRESMIRIADKQVFDQLAQFIQAGRKGGKEGDAERPSLADRENPKCSSCDSQTVLKKNYGKLFYQCCKCDQQTNYYSRKAHAKPQSNAKGLRKCPNCDVILKVKDGKYGMFLSCPNYPSCKYSCNLHSKKRAGSKY